MVTNGNIPASEMVQRQGLWLWPSTAAKFDAMNADLTNAGYPGMVITQPYGAYRSKADQVAVKKIYGKGAATPGYSNHGLARAWDIYNIDRYPAGVIPTVAKRHALLIDAGNGAGGIESWHMHDADGIAPAGTGTITPIIISEKEEDDDMKIALYGTGCIVIDSVHKQYRYIDNNKSTEYSLLVANPESRGVVFDTISQGMFNELTTGFTRIW